MLIKLIYCNFRKVRIIEFTKTFSNLEELDSVTSVSNNSSEVAAAVCYSYKKIIFILCLKIIFFFRL